MKITDAANAVQGIIDREYIEGFLYVDGTWLRKGMPDWLLTRKQKTALKEAAHVFDWLERHPFEYVTIKNRYKGMK